MLSNSSFYRLATLGKKANELRKIHQILGFGAIFGPGIAAMIKGEKSYGTGLNPQCPKLLCAFLGTRMKLSLFCPNWLCTQIKADQSGRIPHISILLSSPTLPCGTLQYISLQYTTVHYITVQSTLRYITTHITRHRTS